MEQEKQQRCENCHKLFPQSKVNSHYSYCRRNIRRCQQCGEFIDVNYEQQHIQEFHENVACKWCSKALSKSELEGHQQNCLQKPKRCDYCETEVRRVDYDRHIADCGSRTKPCPICQRNIVLRQYEFHTEVCTGREVEQPKVVPTVQRASMYSKPVLREEYRRADPPSGSFVKQSLLGQRIETSQLRSNESSVPSTGQNYSQTGGSRQATGTNQQVQQVSSVRQSGSTQQQSSQIQSSLRSADQQQLIRSNDPALKPGIKVIYPQSSSLSQQYPQSNIRQSTQQQPQPQQAPTQASKIHASNLASYQPQKVTVSYNYNPAPPQHYLDDELDQDTEVQKAILENIQKSKGPVMTHSSQYQVNPASYQNIYSHHHHQPKPNESGLSRHQPTANTNPLASYVSNSHQTRPHHSPPVDTSGEDLLNQSFYGDLEFQEQIQASLKKDHHHHHQRH